MLGTSNMPFSRWGEVCGDDMAAAVMIDRLVHHAEVITLTGDSYRTRARRKLLARDRPRATRTTLPTTSQTDWPTNPGGQDSYDARGSTVERR